MTKQMNHLPPIFLDAQENDSVQHDDVIMLPERAFRNRSVVTHVRYNGLSNMMPTRPMER